jgi:parallel beta-helix repeat protein
MSIVSTLTKSGPFAFTGSPQVIPTGFSFQSQADLLVLDYGPALGATDPATVLILGSDYTVTGGSYNSANEMQTGSITVVSGGMSNVQVGDNLIIMRNAPLNQLSSFLASGPLTATLLEQMGDKLATLSQQVNELGQRSLHFENFETQNGLLNFTARAGKLIGFDTSGNLQFSTGSSGSGTTYTAGPGLILASNQFSVNPTQSLTDLTVTNPIAGSITGNAATATILQTARTINGVSFNGSTNITVTAAAGTLTGSALNASVTSAPGLVSASIGTFGTMAIQAAGSVAITGGTITGMPTPTNAADVANKSYVDTHASGVVQRTGVQVATTANLAALSGEQTIDGVLTSTSRILVKNQTLSQNNGIYVTAAGAWSRATDSDTAGELLVGYYYFVSLGTTQGATGWTIQTAPTILGTDPIVFGQFSASTTYTAGSGLTLAGNVFSVNSAQPLITSVGTLTSLNVSGSITGAAGSFTTINASDRITTTLAGGQASSMISTTAAGIYQLWKRNTVIQASFGNADVVVAGGNANDFALDASAGNLVFSISSVAKATITSTGIQAAIGQTTPMAGAFTSISSTSGVLNASIGTVTPNTGAFTTLSGSVTATGSISSLSLANRFAQVVNVKDFGAVGNGTTDDTGALYNARLQVQALGSHATLYFPAGKYRITSGIGDFSGVSYVTVTGDGAEVFNDTGTSGTNTFVFDSTCSNIDFRGLRLTGNSSVRGSGIHIRMYSDDSSITGCYIQGCSDFGIHVSNSGSAATINVVVSNNIIEGTLGDGIHVGSARMVVISGNVIRSTGDDGIGIVADSASLPPKLVTAIGNRIEASSSAGIRIDEGEDISLIGNSIHTTAGAGIDVGRFLSTTAYNNRIFITNNVLYNTQTTPGPLGAIWLKFTNECTVRGNNVHDNASGSGIVYLDCQGMVIRDNVLQGIQSRAIASDDTTTSGVATSWDGLTIMDNDIQYMLANQAIYIVPNGSTTIHNIMVIGNSGNELPTGSWIYYQHCTTGKIGNNSSRDSRAVTDGGSNVSITTFNNN